MGKAIGSCATYLGLVGILSGNSMKFQGLRQYRVLCDLHGQYGWKSFRTRSLRADRVLCDLQAPVSVAGGIFGPESRCAARSRDAAGDSGACIRRAFRTFPFAAHKHRESNLGSPRAIADWTSALASGGSPADHRSLAVL
jgi:hypothetical protein